ncbi:hypothetical protein OB2597_19531 [Pseudooceanicola batsensis HTCC2597]|uniref:DUF2783 domain-containing protein n=1 Tax=Pseudooceanicola batsensis (strain ATCC BAA-863 / DSM 15984 / KCTC 12145 / HTCC2597) TaxID=252305 RepID=A3U0L6_PSEBH|nr:DUF2783 domain-containing protein [Pseudooceanicola batsensis]EAQ02307.1 hypothetical protein OB2597_19531 [Pseudooceanicola batsensis HTCC2597]
MPLNTKPNIEGPDEFYAELIRSHEGLSDEDSAALNARLILLLANHIGDRAVLSEAMSAARLSVRDAPGAGDVG